MSITPDAKFWMLSFRARPMARPAVPKIAIRLVVSKPHWVRTASSTTIHITAFSTLWKNWAWTASKLRLAMNLSSRPRATLRRIMATMNAATTRRAMGASFSSAVQRNSCHLSRLASMGTATPATVVAVSVTVVESIFLSLEFGFRAGKDSLKQGSVVRNQGSVLDTCSAIFAVFGRFFRHSAVFALS